MHKHDKIRDDPMDLDSVVKGKGKNKFSGSCYICGKVGHKATECWSRDTASNKSSGRNQSANEASSGKGKSVGQGTEGVKGHPKARAKAREKANGKPRAERDFRAADPPIPWSLRWSLGMRPMRRSRKSGGIHGPTVRSRNEMELPLGPSWWEVRSWS